MNNTNIQYFKFTNLNILPFVNTQLGSSKIHNDPHFLTDFKTLCGNIDYIPITLDKVPRIVVFGDIHGDFNLVLNLLKLSGVATYIGNDEFLWTGGSTYVVQIGDQIDRCRPSYNTSCNNPLTTFNDEHSDIKILKLFTNLHKQAIKVGGKVISLLGNHEIMNSLGYLDYVSYKGLQGFYNYKDPQDPNLIFNNGTNARKYAFAPGNEYGKLLGCTRVSTVIIGSNLFVHAGLVTSLIHKLNLVDVNDLENINIAIRKWLLGILDIKYVNNLINGSLFWTRILGNLPPNVPLDNPICLQNIGDVLKIFNLNGMIIGHTPQSFMNNDSINHTCGDKVWRVDNGSSIAFNNLDSTFISSGIINSKRNVQYLEILNDSIYNIHSI